MIMNSSRCPIESGWANGRAPDSSNWGEQGGRSFMDFSTFVEGPLLWIVFVILIAAVFSRLAFFTVKILKSGGRERTGPGYYMSVFGRFLVPFHKALAKKPLYAILRYVFHLFLFVVPIWLSGHIVLWSESRFEWDWKSLPDAWADWMTIILLTLAIYFLIRRLVSAEVRLSSSSPDYLIILLAWLPFATGYFLTHGTLDSIPFFKSNMRVIHVLSGEAMMLMTALLFCRTRLNPKTCTGCASCELSCPTGTIETRDQGGWRVFNYSHYQCICCGACVNTCPENAAELRHEISLRRFFQIVPKHEIRTVELKSCKKCGAPFVPEPLFGKINRTFTDDYLHFCPNCRKTNIGDLYRRLSPWHKAPGEGVKRPVPISQ
jgi:Pyruvate/2-oxoacid:ferredoxin oxidoreductase delta subunit